MPRGVVEDVLDRAHEEVRGAHDPDVLVHRDGRRRLAEGAACSGSHGDLRERHFLEGGLHVRRRAAREQQQVLGTTDERLHLLERPLENMFVLLAGPRE